MQCDVDHKPLETVPTSDDEVDKENAIGELSFLPFVKTDELSVGRKYKIKRMELVLGQYGQRIRVYTDEFRYELPQRFTSELRDYDLDVVPLDKVYFIYSGREKCGKFT